MSLNPRARRAAAVALLMALAAAPLVAWLVLRGSGGSGETVAPDRPPPARRLVTGITEGTPALLTPGAVPAAFAPSRDLLRALRPRYFRLFVNWRQVQPAAGAPANFAVPSSGCVRDIPPCAPWQGIRDQLRALAASRAEDGFPEVIVTLLGTPDWAASPPTGCEPPGGATPAARVPAPAALPAYRALVRGLLAVARQEGVPLRHWSAWNEPNHPTFLNPQRERCDAEAPTLAPGRYLPLVRALRAELDAAPGEQLVLLGDLAGVVRGRERFTSVGEFVDALPRAEVCAARAWAQHAYIPARNPGSRDLFRQLERALDAKRCARPVPIWVTETGAGPGRGGVERDTVPAELKAECRSLQAALDSWYRDPRIDLAIQYTFRQDPVFQVGLAEPALRFTFPVYDVWRAWGARPSPTSAPPPLPARCR